MILDASAVVALLRREAGYQKVVPLLTRGAAIAAPNLAEALVQIDRRGHHLNVAEMTVQLQRAGLSVLPVEEEDATMTAHLLLQSAQLAQAGELDRPLSLGDATCVAVAIRHRIPVVCADRAWDKLEVPVRVHQIR